MSKKNGKHLPPEQPPANEVLLRQQGQQELAQEVVGFMAASFSGPLPPPEVLDKYNQIIPNGAERIMAMAEKQSSHRRQLEKTVITTDSRNSLLGIIFALIIGLATITIGGIVIYAGHGFAGTFLGSAGLTGLVSTFIYGTRQRRQERETKHQENP